MLSVVNPFFSNLLGKNRRPQDQVGAAKDRLTMWAISLMRSSSSADRSKRECGRREVRREAPVPIIGSMGHEDEINSRGLAAGNVGNAPRLRHSCLWDAAIAR